MKNIKIDCENHPFNVITLTFPETVSWESIGRVRHALLDMIAENYPEPIHILLDFRNSYRIPSSIFIELYHRLLHDLPDNHQLVLVVAEWDMLHHILDHTRRILPNTLDNVRLTKSHEEAYALIEHITAYS